MQRWALTTALLVLPLPMAADQIIIQGGGMIEVIQRVNGQPTQKKAPTVQRAPAANLNVDLSQLKFPALDKALEQSQQDGRQIIVTTRASWDDWSKQMTKNIFNDERYQELMSRKYITVVIDVEKNSKDATIERVVKALQIKSIPETIVFDSKGEQIRRLGFIDGNLDKFIQAVSENGDRSDAERISNFQRNGYYNQQIQLQSELRKPEKPVDKAKLNEVNKQQQQGIWGGIQINGNVVIQKAVINKELEAKNKALEKAAAKKKALEKNKVKIQKDLEKSKPKVKGLQKIKVKKIGKIQKAPVNKAVGKEARAKKIREIDPAVQAPPAPEEIEQMFEDLINEARGQDNKDKNAENKDKEEANKPKIKLIKPRGVIKEKEAVEKPKK